MRRFGNLWYYLAAKDPALNADQRISRWINIGAAGSLVNSLGGGIIGSLFNYPWAGVAIGLALWFAILYAVVKLGTRSQLSTSSGPPPEPEPESAAPQPAPSDTDFTPEELASRHIHNRPPFSIRKLVEAAGVDGTLTGWTFETCAMYGPAIITHLPPSAQEDADLISGGVVGTPSVTGFSTELRFEGDDDSVFYEIPSGGTNAKGVIHLPGCHFYQVTFRNIGVAGTPEELESWRASATFIREH